MCVLIVVMYMCICVYVCMCVYCTGSHMCICVYVSMHIQGACSCLLVSKYGSHSRMHTLVPRIICGAIVLF